MPRIRFHVVMDNPDSVSLVTPPSETAPATIPQHPRSQHPKMYGRRCNNEIN